MLLQTFNSGSFCRKEKKIKEKKRARGEKKSGMMRVRRFCSTTALLVTDVL